MAEIKRSILFGKLNPIAYKAIESATIFSKMRGNPYVELVRWLNHNFAKLTGDSPEESLGAADQAGAAPVSPGETSGALAPAAMGKQEALGQFSVDLTEKARKGEIDPILGRDGEIRQIVDILIRRRQNNPILTGEAGVGKTAVVEGFALRIAAGDIPPALKEGTLRTLDLGLLQAGASKKSEFENRLCQVIEEVQASPKPIILFIDEAHTLIGERRPDGGRHSHAKTFSRN